jgi:hypothetical protein
VIRNRFRKRKAISFLGDIVDHHWFLMLPNPAGDGTFDWNFCCRLPLCGNARLHEVTPHQMSLRIVKDDSHTPKLK